MRSAGAALPHLPDRAAVSGAERRGQRHHRRAAAPARCRRGARAGARVLRRLDLFDKRHRLASTLTLPDRKRLEVARALATGPRLLVARRGDGGPAADRDRPHGRDPRALNRDGLTILLIEHVMRAVMALASRVLVLDHGTAIAEGTPERSCAIRRSCSPISASRRCDAARRTSFPSPLVGGIVTLTQQKQLPTTPARDRPIRVTDEMVRAGWKALTYHGDGLVFDDCDPFDLVRQIYIAMRRAELAHRSPAPPKKQVA